MYAAPVQRDIAVAGEDIAPVQRDIAVAGEDIAPVQRDIAVAGEDIAPVQRDVAVAGEEVATIERSVAVAGEEVATIERSVAVAGEDIAIAERKVTLSLASGAGAASHSISLARRKGHHPMMRRPLLVLTSLAAATTLALACAHGPPAVQPGQPPVASSAPTQPPLPPGEKVCQGNQTFTEMEKEFDSVAQYRSQATQEDDPMRESVLRSTDKCGVADLNLRADADAILAAPQAPASTRASWDKRSKPDYLDLVDRRLHLSAAERAKLFANGFVVPERAEVSSYGYAFHDIFQSELPVYVSMDALFHAVYVVNDSLIEQIEARHLAPMLVEVVASLLCALPDAAGDYPPDVARDSRRLSLRGQRPPRHP